LVPIVSLWFPKQIVDDSWRITSSRVKERLAGCSYPRRMPTPIHGPGLRRGRGRPGRL
jgi:hypothetical protein